MLRLWRPLAGWTLLVWAVGALLFTPLITALIGWGIQRGERIVMGHEELLAWLMTPAGVVWLLLSGVLAIAGSVVRYGGIYRVVNDEFQGRRPAVRRTVLAVLPHLPRLLRLCLAAVVLALLLVCPLLLGWGATYALLLEPHDINYYMAEQPPRWWAGLGIAGIWMLAWLMATTYLVARMAPALPAFLADPRFTMRQALQYAWQLTARRTSLLIGLLAGAVMLWAGAALTLDVLLWFAAAAAMESFALFSHALRPLAMITGGFLASTVAISIVVDFFGFSLVATVLTRFYHYNDKGLEQTGPVVAAPLSGGDHGLDRAREGETRHGAWHPPLARVLPLRAWLSPKRFLSVMAVFLLASSLYGTHAVNRLPELQDVKVVAHRAGPSPAPENTLAALELAVDSRADYSEIDVQSTRDGTVVVIHDADLMRVAGDPRRIAEHDFSELHRVLQFPDGGFGQELRGLATLEEFLDRAGERIRLMIELKYYGTDDDLAGRVVQLVREKGMEDQVVLMSFHLDVVRELQRLAPGIPSGFVSAVSTGDLTRLDVDFLALHQQRVTPRLISAAQERELPIYAWTVNQTGTMVDQIEQGVDGLITDHPHRAARVLQELQQMNYAERLLLRFRQILVEERTPYGTLLDTTNPLEPVFPVAPVDTAGSVDQAAPREPKQPR